MKIAGVRTYLMSVSPPGQGGWSARNWLFVKVFIDEVIYGVGEASGWPRVVETANKDLTPLTGGRRIHIERLWSKMMASNAITSTWRSQTQAAPAGCRR